MLTPHRRALDDHWLSVSRPTRFTRWWRVFIPWQMIRFVVINVRMVGIILRGRH